MNFVRCTRCLIVLATFSLMTSACDTVSRGTDMVTGLMSKPRLVRAKPAADQAGRQGSDTRAGVNTDIVGMTDRQVQSTFGSPSYVRHEQPAAIWQYRQTNCIVDLFMYAEGAEGQYKVEHVELRPLEAGGALSVDQRRVCFGELTRVS